MRKEHDLTLDGVIAVYDDIVKRGVAYVRLVKGFIFEFPGHEVCRIHLDGKMFVLSWPVVAGNFVRFKSCAIPDEVIDCDYKDLLGVLKRAKEIERNQHWEDWQAAFQEEIAGIEKGDLIGRDRVGKRKKRVKFWND